MRKLIMFISLIAVFSAILPDSFVMAEQEKSPSIWVSIYRSIFKRKEPPINPRNAGSRPAHLVCMVSPDAPSVTRTIWSDRPVFIWQGKVREIKVLVDGNTDIWHQQLNQNQQSITYTGKPLNPGETYDWMVNNNQFVSFKIMDKRERDRITLDLRNIENRLKSTGANIEAIAYAKANYFADKNLWSDVLQEIYSVPKPSPELKQLRRDITQKLCQ
jgi:hypothetical protein